jgi:hypothetical protein
MPTFRHGKSTKVYFDQYDLSPYLNDVSVQQSADASETTSFGQSAKTYIAGLQDAKITAKGMFDGVSTDGSDVILPPTLGSTSDSTVSYFPDGFVDASAGSARVAKLARVLSTSYEVSSPVADIVSISAELQADGLVDDGVLFFADKSVSTATTTNSGSWDNTTSTANGGVANLHVTANAATGNTTFKIQHSADNTTFADLGTFTVVPTVTKTSERLTIATGTTVNRYVRAQAVTANTGAVTFTIAFARR